MAGPVTNESEVHNPGSDTQIASSDVPRVSDSSDRSVTTKILEFTAELRRSLSSHRKSTSSNPLTAANGNGNGIEMQRFNGDEERPSRRTSILRSGEPILVAESVEPAPDAASTHRRSSSISGAPGSPAIQLTGGAYSAALAPTTREILLMLGAEAAAKFIASGLHFGLARSYTEDTAAALIERHWPDMDPYGKAALQALLTAPVLAAAHFVGEMVVRPALLSLMGASLNTLDPKLVYRDATQPPGESNAVFKTRQDQVTFNRQVLVEIQAANKIGRLPADFVGVCAFGFAQGVRGAFGTSAPWARSLASATGGALMAAGHSTMALLTRTQDGHRTHYVGKPSDVKTVVDNSVDGVVVATTADGAKTDSTEWKARNLVQDVFGVRASASLFGLFAANAYKALVDARPGSSGGVETFWRGFGGTLATLGTFFFPDLSLNARRGKTDEILSGTLGALGNLSPNNHPGSLAKVFSLGEDSFYKAGADVVEGLYHFSRIAATVPAHFALDLANLLVKPLHPPLPEAPAGEAGDDDAARIEVLDERHDVVVAGSDNDDESAAGPSVPHKPLVSTGLDSNSPPPSASDNGAPQNSSDLKGKKKDVRFDGSSSP